VTIDALVARRGVRAFHLQREVKREWEFHTGIRDAERPRRLAERLRKGEQ